MLPFYLLLYIIISSSICTFLSHLRKESKNFHRANLPMSEKGENLLETGYPSIGLTLWYCTRRGRQSFIGSQRKFIAVYIPFRFFTNPPESDRGGSNMAGEICSEIGPVWSYRDRSMALLAGVSRWLRPGLNGSYGKFQDSVTVESLQKCQVSFKLMTIKIGSLK